MQEEYERLLIAAFYDGKLAGTQRGDDLKELGMQMLQEKSDQELAVQLRESRRQQAVAAESVTQAAEAAQDQEALNALLPPPPKTASGNMRVDELFTRLNNTLGGVGPTKQCREKDRSAASLVEAILNDVQQTPVRVERAFSVSEMRVLQELSFGIDERTHHVSGKTRPPLFSADLTQVSVFE